MMRIVTVAAAILLTTAAAVPRAAGPSLSIALSGRSLSVVLSNGGSAVVIVNYDPGKDDTCAGRSDVPCFQFRGADGTMMLPTTAAGCKTDGGFVECPATGVAAVTIDLKNGGSLIETCKSASCSGSECFANTTIHAAAGDDSVYSVKTTDGCMQTITCTAGFGTVQADQIDKVSGCAMVERTARVEHVAQRPRTSAR